MNDKSLFTRLSETIDEYRAEQKQRNAQAEQSGNPAPRQRRWRWLLPTPGNVAFTLVIVFSLLWAQSAGALGLAQNAPNASTNTIAYQGRLADSGGNPLTGTYPMIFRLYNVASGGSPLWEENWNGANSVAVSDGLFNVMLGSLTPVSQSVLANNASLWLGISVGSDSEMAPRVQLGSVPYAFQALTVPDGSITAAKLASNSVTSANIVDGTIQAVDLASGSLPAGVPIGSVVSWWRPDANTPLPSGEWAVADGSLVTDPASPLYGKNLPDLRNRFVMGVSLADIGQSGGSNTLNLNHQHQVDSHTHTIPSHAHSDGELYANVSVEDDRVYVKRYGPSFNASNANYTGSSHSNTHYTDASADIGGITGYWSGTSGTSAPYTSFSLSSTVDNRPQYYGVIYLVRIK